jgi:hypothetical protein
MNKKRADPPSLKAAQKLKATQACFFFLMGNLPLTGCEPCAVRGREDDGAGVCGPRIQNLSISSGSVRFSTLGKTISENEIHGKGGELRQ